MSITDLLNNAPTEEPERQYYFIAEAKKIIEKKEQELGRKLTCCVTTFGCQMNEYDSERLAGFLEKEGWHQVDEYAGADLGKLNTCCIREKATHKIYSEVGRINIEKQKMKKQGRYMVIALLGCVPEVEKEKMFSKAPAIDILLSPQSHLKLLDYVKQILDNLEEKVSKDGKRKTIIPKKTHFAELELDANLKFDFLKEERENFNGVSAYITIQEGCNKFCTYCVVPNTRGRELPRKAEDILKEANEVAKQGAKEIILLGQNVSSYKYTDSNGKKWTLVELIEEVANIKEILRIRYITSHPRDITQELIELHKKEKKLTPYLHLPVQSGSNEILKKMNRKYTRDFYLDIIKRFREAVPNIVFSSDFIVGFPSEMEENFEDTIKLVKEVGYKAQCFSFKYSRRPNTVANTMKEQISDNIASKRLEKLQLLLEEQRMEFSKSLNGKIVNVLFDNINMQNKMQACGRDEFMHLVVINCQNEEEKNKLFGKLLEVKIVKIEPNVLIGKVAVK